MESSLSIYIQMVHLADQEGNQRDTIPLVEPSFFTSSQQLLCNSFSGFIPDFIKSPERIKTHCLLGKLGKDYLQFYE